MLFLNLVGAAGAALAVENLINQLHETDDGRAELVSFSQHFTHDLEINGQTELATHLIAALLARWNNEKEVNPLIFQGIITMCIGSKVRREDLTSMLSKLWEEGPKPRTSRLHSETLYGAGKYIDISELELEKLRFRTYKDSLVRACVAVEKEYFSTAMKILETTPIPPECAGMLIITIDTWVHVGKVPNYVATALLKKCGASPLGDKLLEKLVKS